MTPDMMNSTIVLLINHEEDRKRAYLDPYGNITAGIGHNLSARDIEDDIRDRWVRSDILEFYNLWHDTFDWFKHLNEARQIALIDFSFMGWKHVLTFQKMLDCLSHNDFNGAVEQLFNSTYAGQVGKRADDIANILLKGELNV